MSPLLPSICINAFPFSKSSDDIVLCTCICLLIKPVEGEAEGARDKERVSWAKLPPQD